MKKNFITKFMLISMFLFSSAHADPLSCDFSDILGSPIEIVIANGDVDEAHFRIPRDYVISTPVYDGETREALLMKVDKNTFAPFLSGGNPSPSQKDRFRAGFRDYLTILIDDLNPIDVIARSLLGAPNYGSGTGSPDVDLGGVLVPHGLYGQRIRPRPHFSEIFLGKLDGIITDVLACDQIGDVPFPNCDLMFEAGEFDLKVSFGRSDIKHWREYKERTASFMKCITRPAR